MKETLEEAAERLYQYQSQNPPYTIITPKDKVEGFMAGAKWQAKQMYSEEEVRKIAEEARWQAIGDPLEFTKNFDKWFEQFKNK
jgi:hypothetical protein